MRSTYDGSILKSEDRRFIGVSLGSDSCAEHEWGISRLSKVFGIPASETVFGVGRRKVTSFPKLLQFVTVKHKTREGRKQKTLTYKGIFCPKYSDEKPTIDWIGESGLYTAWDGESFCVLSSIPEEQEMLFELYEQIQEGNVVMWLGRGHVFKKTSGLNIAIIDRIDPVYTAEWDRFDREQYQLKLDVAESGIEKILKDAGKKWFALSPNREPDGSIMFFLNPYNIDKSPSCKQARYGWFSLEDLQAWARDEGPVVTPKNIP
jgi:hypothetical protein